MAAAPVRGVVCGRSPTVGADSADAGAAANGAFTTALGAAAMPFPDTGAAEGALCDPP